MLDGHFASTERHLHGLASQGGRLLRESCARLAIWPFALVFIASGLLNSLLQHGLAIGEHFRFDRSPSSDRGGLFALQKLLVRVPPLLAFFVRPAKGEGPPKNVKRGSRSPPNHLRDPDFDEKGGVGEVIWPNPPLQLWASWGWCKNLEGAPPLGRALDNLSGSGALLH